MSKKLASLRARAFRAQGHRCFYCGCLMWTAHAEAFRAQFGLKPGEAHAFQCTAEHLVARQDGGEDRSDNIVAACHHCNRTRHARSQVMSPDRYKAHVANRVRRGRWHSVDATEKGLVEFGAGLRRNG